MSERLILNGKYIHGTIHYFLVSSHTSPRPRGCKNYPELPCELTEKLTGTADSTRLVSSNQARFAHYQYNTNITHSLYAGGGGGGGVLLMPPRVNPAGAINNKAHVTYINL